MNKSLRRRVAAVATTATVGGLLLPFLAAGSAFAIPPALPAPTGLTASPSNAAANSSSNAIFKITSNIAAAGNVYAQGLTGPDANVAPQLCVRAAPVYTCTFPTGVTPGTDTVRFFYDANGTGAYQANAASTTANLTVAGPVNSLALTPASPASVAGSDYKKYTVLATDAAGRPVVNTNVRVTATEAKTTNADLQLLSVKPGADFIAGAKTSTPATVNTATKTLPGAQLAPVTANGTAGTVAGEATFYVASRNPGTISLAVATDPAIAGLGASGSLVVNGGTTEDVTAVTLTPNAQRAFVGDLVTAVVNVQNAQLNPVAGITPVVLVNGTALPAVAATNGDGNTTVNYVAAGAGTDTLSAFVNQAKSNPATLGLDSGEPSTNQVTPPTVTVVARDVTGITNDGAPGFSVPLNVKSTIITYTVKTSGNTQAGYNVLFTSSDPLFTLSPTSAVTDAAGKVSVTVTKANPSDGENANIVARIGTFADARYTSTAGVFYSANAAKANSVKITPFANTTVAGGTATFTATATDPNGSPVAGATFAWTVVGPRNTGANNAGVTGNGPTFSYSDKGAANAAGQDTVQVQVSGGNSGFAAAQQYWVTTAARATQANIDLNGTPPNANPANKPDGEYIQNNAGLPVGTNGPIQPSKFDTTIDTKVTPDPTALKPFDGKPQFVAVKLTDEANNRLYGKTVTFSSSGAGVFTDAQGNTLGTSATAVVADQNAANPANDNNFKGLPIGSYDGFATVYVRSTVPGKQLITATVDGVSTNATVNYTGQFVGVAPTRVVDTRTGEGALQAFGTTAPTGPLAPNTSYSFNYQAAGMPLGAAAYAFNVTAINPSGVGNLRVYPPTGGPVPTTSLVNYQPGKDVANFVIVPNVGNAVQLFSASSSADVTIDLVGYYPAGNSITPVVPSRIADTRNAGGGGAVAANTTRTFQVAGSGNIPASGTVKAVALNVTVVNPSSLGNLRIFADGAAVPTTSNINYIPGQDKSAFVIVNLPTNGKINVYSAGTAVDVAIDAYAFFDQASTLVTQTPVRALDTRSGSALSVSQPRELQIAGTSGVPADASAVLVSVTGIHTTGSTGVGNLRLYPSGGTFPIVSTLNYVSSTTDVANFAIVKLGANGSISINSEGSPIDVAVDVVGYVPAGS